VAYFSFLFCHLPEGDRDKPKESQCSSRYSNRSPPDYKYVSSVTACVHIPRRFVVFLTFQIHCCRSQWPRGLRHELFSPARALGL
jgi:hypothetical protein